MRKLLLPLVLVLISFAANAQTRFGFTGGINLATISQNYSDSDFEGDPKFRPGFRLGAVADLTITEAFVFRTGLAYSSKGYKIEQSENFGGASIEGEGRLISNYLEVPLTAVFKTGNFEIFAGPYVAFGIGGKYKAEGSFTFQGTTERFDEELDVKFKGSLSDSEAEDEETVYQRPLDLGLSIGAGYNVGPGLISLSFSKGLSNLTPEQSGFEPKDFKETNTVLNLSFTYFLGGK